MRIELNGKFIGEIGDRGTDADLNAGVEDASPCWAAEAPESTVKILEAEGLRIVFVRHEDNTLVVRRK
jgi:hypothetical protein